jgi:phosphate transport system permease protein
VSTSTTTLSTPGAPGGSAVRRQMAAATQRIARLKRIDRAAVAVITLGGIAVVVAVLGILLFIGAEAVPLFRSAALLYRAAVPAAVSPSPTSTAPAAALPALGVDEYLRNFFTINTDGLVVFRRLTDGRETHAFPVPGLETATVTTSSRSLLNNFIAAGLSDGRLALMQVRVSPVFTNQTVTDVTVEVQSRATVRFDGPARVPRAVSYIEQDDQKFAAAILGNADLAYWWTDAEGTEHQAALPVAAGQRPTHIRLGRNGNVIVGTDRGRVYHWEAGDAPTLTDVSPVSDRPITALEWMLGGNSYVAAAADGTLSSWFRAPVGENGDLAMVRAHEFEPQTAPVVALAMSPRDRSFLSLGEDASILLRHQTSERTLAATIGSPGLGQVVLAPRSNAVLALGPNRLEWWALRNAHPEVSWKVIFGKVWYEGYGQPEYVWQSTGATDDFEAKFSLVPLIFGTIKGTFYALLFAIPLAVFGALYTSQFVHPAIRSKIKPVVEIMAALPSVVIGFLAGLYLASVVERNLTAIFLMPVLLPLFGTAGVFIWRVLPRPLVRRLPAGTEVVLIVPLLVLAAALSMWAGPIVETVLFGGDVRGWLHAAFGVTYDQRNSLVVGLAMGFAVIPIIFTISEDAFSSVPSSLTAASLALGASRWQTAVRVVLPTASPGIFSAIMVGFGRAVGETMIVLMATGNTPVLDWSIFNGMRTLSANIAVEIPEAPHGGTLYRILFLAATILFIMTFAVNTIAELVRQRLRERYKAI